jgi:hypothetical protein
MSTLSTVIAAILRDLAGAQEMGMRKSLQVRSCDLELRFAIAETSTSTDERVLPDPARSRFEPVAARIAAAAVGAAAAHLEERLDLADDRERWERIAGHIAGDDFRRFVTEHLATALYQRRRTFIGAAGTELSFDRDMAARVAYDALSLHLFDNPALERVFAPHSRGLDRLMQHLGPLIDERLAGLAAELAAAPRRPALPDLDVLVTSADLAAVDPTRVSTIRLRIEADETGALAMEVPS